MKNNILENFIYLIIFGLPAYLIRFKIFGIPFTGLEILILLMFLLFVIKTRGKFSLGSYKYIIYSFIIVSFIACIMSVDNLAALGLLKAYLLEPVLFFIVLINVQPKFSKVLWALGLSALFVSAIGIIQYLSGYGIPAPWNIRGPEFRITSVYEYPNAVGLYLTPIIVLFLGNIVVGKRRIYPSLLIIAVSLFAVFAAQTQGAYLAILAGLFFLGLFTKWRKIFFGGLMVGIIIILVVPSIKEIVTFQDTSGDVRVALWQGTWNLIKDRPLVGAGLASFPAVYPQYKLAKHVESLLYPHNIFLDFWVELGLCGLLWLLWVLVKFFKNNFSAKKPKNIVLMAAMIAILVYGLVDVTYFKNDLSVLFWLILGLAESCRKEMLMS